MLTFFALQFLPWNFFLGTSASAYAFFSSRFPFLEFPLSHHFSLPCFLSYSFSFLLFSYSTVISSVPFIFPLHFLPFIFPLALVYIPLWFILSFYTLFFLSISLSVLFSPFTCHSSFPSPSIFFSSRTLIFSLPFSLRVSPFIHPSLLITSFSALFCILYCLSLLRFLCILSRLILVTFIFSSVYLFLSITAVKEFNRVNMCIIKQLLKFVYCFYFRFVVYMYINYLLGKP